MFLLIRPSDNAWLVSYSGLTDWAVINHDYLNPDLTRFGDVTGDGKDDVFTQLPDGTWVRSDGGTEPWVTINGGAFQPTTTWVGDLNGDGREDVVAINADWSWAVSYSGNSPWQIINNGYLKPSAAQLVDVNGDGRSDIYAAFDDGSWRVSYSGTSIWTVVNNGTLDPTRTWLADMTGDGTADVFSIQDLSRWVISESAAGAWRLLNNGYLPSDEAALSLPPSATDDVTERPATGKIPASVVSTLAPRVRLHPNEDYWPLSAHTFSNRSKLGWAHDDVCPDHKWGRPDKRALGDGLYLHQQTYGLYCTHEGPFWRSDQSTKAGKDGGPSGHEGFYLDLDNDYHDGQGFQGTEPVYYTFEPRESIQYWFTYGYSETLGFGHEGDWERIAIRLDDNNVPQEVQYFQHHQSCTLPWSSNSEPTVPKADGRPIIWVALKAHGSYPANSDPHSNDKISGNGDLWLAQNNLDNVRDMPWYGYGGGWGKVSSLPGLSGPDGPPHKGNPGFATPRCDMD